jgi:kynurenine formamidase
VIVDKANTEQLAVTTISQLETEMLQARKVWDAAWKTARALRAPNSPAFQNSYAKYVAAQKVSDEAWLVYSALKASVEK